MWKTTSLESIKSSYDEEWMRQNTNVSDTQMEEAIKRTDGNYIYRMSSRDLWVLILYYRREYVKGRLMGLGWEWYRRNIEHYIRELNHRGIDVSKIIPSSSEAITKIR